MRSSSLSDTRAGEVAHSPGDALTHSRGKSKTHSSVSRHLSTRISDRPIDAFVSFYPSDTAAVLPACPIWHLSVFFFCIADDLTPLCSPHFTYFFFSSKLSFHSPLSFLCRWRRAGEAEGRTRRRHLANSEVHPVDGEVKAQEILVVCPRGDKANVRGWRRHVISKIRSWLLFKRSPFTNPAWSPMGFCPRVIFAPSCCNL